MRVRTISLVCITTFIAMGMFGGIFACGGVDVAKQGPDPLALLELTPHGNEVDVTKLVDVVAVFSASVTLAEGDSNLNEQTFFVRLEGGDKLDSVVALSELGSDGKTAMGDTAIIRLQDLTPGATYSIFVSGKLQGMDTGPLGVDVHSSFTVVQ